VKATLLLSRAEEERVRGKLSLLDFVYLERLASVDQDASFHVALGAILRGEAVVG
jgi:hypothetical protein